MTIRLRIFLFNLISVFIATFVVALIGLKIVESTVVDSTYERLTQIRINKSTAIESYFRDLQTVSNLIRVHELTDDILTTNAGSALMPFRRLLDNYVLDFNIFDLALINNQGSVVYSTRKTVPDGSSINKLPPASAKLKEIYRWGLAAEEETFLFSDFTRTGKEAEPPSSFLATPIFKNGKRLGTLVFKISMSEIDHITSDNFSWATNGMGQTGETLVYGENWKLRNTGRFLISQASAENILKDDFLKQRGDENIKEIENLNEVRDTGIDYRGQKVIRSIGKIYLPNGQIWYIQSKIDESEAFAVLDRIAIASGAAAILIFILFFFFTFAATAKVVEPIQLLTESLEKLGTTNLTRKINYQSNDEIGLLVNQYNNLADRLETTTVSKEFLDSVIQSIKAFLFIVRVTHDQNPGSEQFRIIQANESALNVLEVSAADLLNKDLKNLLRTSENLGDFRWLLKNRNSIEAQLFGPNGINIPILMNWAALPHIAGKEPTFVFVCTDITDRKSAEKDLIKAREDAVKASQAKSEFLARMSHEIRTPLNSIIGITDVLAESELNADQEKLVRVCANAGENLLSLVNDILDISKIEAREVKLERIPFDVASTTRNICDILKQKALEKNLEFQLSVQIAPEASPRIIGDPTRIRQILFNLIGNAIKFTQQGKISVLLDFDDDHKKCLRFSIVDSGTGIPEDKQHLLFQNFVQADSSITRRYGGSGLGLTISKNLVELMGGRIWFESHTGQGSSFYFTVPYQPTQELIEEAPAPATAPPRSLTQRKAKILVVDDTDDNRFLFMTYLKHFPFEIAQAENGKEAVRKVKQDNFDLIFMDIQMPIMDGYAATHLIREWEKDLGREPLPIVAVSANAMMEDIQKSLEAGCTEHVTKPLKKSALIELVQRYIL